MAKVLIVEDDVVVQVAVARAVHRMGHAAVTAGDGRMVLRLADDEAVRMMIVDLRLPGKPCGVDLVAALRQKRPDCPVMVLTASRSMDDELACLRLGVAAYVTKPFSILTVTQTIDDLLNGRLQAPAFFCAKAG